MFFRTVPNVKSMMVPLADFAFNDLKLRKVAIISQQNSFGAEHAAFFKEEFERLGGIIVGAETVATGQMDVRSELTKLKAKNPDGVLNLNATGPSMGETMKEGKELGLDVAWMAHYAAENAPLVEQYGSVVDGLIYPYPYSSGSSEEMKSFEAAYAEKFEGVPDMFSANSFDALMLLAEAIGKVGKDPAAVKGQLLSVKNFEGASGTLSFDENGDVQKPILIKEIRGGKFVVLKK
jgi:branched-chain amino acid transport system substrate-binding protein